MRTIKILLGIYVSLIFTINSAIAQIASVSGIKPCMNYADLINLKLPDVSILEVKINKIEYPVAYYQVMGTIGKEINFELLLPLEWNGRFVMGGGGGLVGSIENAARYKINEGYATVGTDTGHKGLGFKGDWALNDMDRQLNFGSLSVHRTATVAKSIISYFYGTWPEYSYFIGCSRGGGQAMIEAQRYPEDFNGIVAGAPGIDYAATVAKFIQNFRALYPEPEKLDKPIISQKHLEMLENAILKQCDELDGVKDRILNNPDICNFNFSVLPRCPDGSASEDCFTEAQINALKTIYKGMENENGSIHPGYPFGCENYQPLGWFDWMVGPSQFSLPFGSPTPLFLLGTEIFKYLIFNNPDWDYSTYDFSNFKKETQYASAYLNATSTDYSQFKKSGGKMIIYQGWNDPAVSAYTAIQHFEDTKKVDQNIEEYIRLFLLPGVLHCGGGPGPSDIDWINIIRSWVEKGDAPNKVVVSKSENGKTIMSRPLFPYPATSEYNGKGDSNLESSFHKKEADTK